MQDPRIACSQMSNFALRPHRNAANCAKQPSVFVSPLSVTIIKSLLDVGKVGIPSCLLGDRSAISLVDTVVLTSKRKCETAWCRFLLLAAAAAKQLVDAVSPLCEFTDRCRSTAIVISQRVTPFYTLHSDWKIATC